MIFCQRVSFWFGCCVFFFCWRVCDDQVLKVQIYIAVTKLVTYRSNKQLVALYFRSPLAHLFPKQRTRCFTVVQELRLIVDYWEPGREDTCQRGGGFGSCGLWRFRRSFRIRRPGRCCRQAISYGSCWFASPQGRCFVSLLHAGVDKACGWKIRLSRFHHPVTDRG